MTSPRNRDLAYSDVVAAFKHFIKVYSADGRPIILASHSQGTMHSKRLLHYIAAKVVTRTHTGQCLKSGKPFLPRIFPRTLILGGTKQPISDFSMRWLSTDVRASDDVIAPRSKAC